MIKKVKKSIVVDPKNPPEQKKTETSKPGIQNTEEEQKQKLGFSPIIGAVKATAKYSGKPHPSETNIQKVQQAEDQKLKKMQEAEEQKNKKEQPREEQKLGNVEYTVSEIYIEKPKAKVKIDKEESIDGQCSELGKELGAEFGVLVKIDVSKPVVPVHIVTKPAAQVVIDPKPNLPAIIKPLVDKDLPSDLGRQLEAEPAVLQVIGNDLKKRGEEKKEETVGKFSYHDDDNSLNGTDDERIQNGTDAERIQNEVERLRDERNRLLTHNGVLQYKIKDVQSQIEELDRTYEKTVPDIAKTLMRNAYFLAVRYKEASNRPK